MAEYWVHVLSPEGDTLIYCGASAEGCETALECGLAISHQVVCYDQSPVESHQVWARNTGSDPVAVTRIDTINRILPPGKYEVDYFSTKRGGTEFTPQRMVLDSDFVLEVTEGRSSRGLHPWFALRNDNGELLIGSVAWSGNWIIRFEKRPDGSVRLSGGLSDRCFSKTLNPGQSMCGAEVLLIRGKTCEFSELVSALGDWGRKWRYPRNSVSESLLVEWNHWFPYTDKTINESIFLENANKAKEMGIEICCLDAGWFGLPPKGDNFWVSQRGNWDIENTERFPHGIAWLGEKIHALGMKFGIWCEIEAVGEQARIAHEHPEWVASREGHPLGYLCMGNPKVEEWAFLVLEKLIVQYRADWIKIDFNLSPGLGCDRLDHGHGAGDGLYEHYLGLYRLLDKVREKYPDVMLEGCSSGGFRIDLGILGHLHKTFLSDPDYPDNALQVYWGALSMLHPSACIHWAWSQTEESYEGNLVNDPYQEELEDWQLDFLIRISLLKCPGFSWRLRQFGKRQMECAKRNISFYKTIRTGFIRDGQAYRLTGQTLRNGEGDRWNAYQFLHRDGMQALVFVFRLTGATESKTIRLQSMKEHVSYSVTDVDSGNTKIVTGRDLIGEGLLISDMPYQSSRVLMISPIDKPM